MSEDLDTAGSLSRLRERARVRARSLRATPTDAEAMLWHHLRDRRMANQKFRRQRPIGPYFADFACLEAKLIVELDGGQHAEAVAYDENRTRFMEAQGYRVLRFWNHEVLTQTDVVRERILQALQEDSPHPNPLPQAGEGARQDTRNLKP
ncbi:Very-short-patch-repair endonuclease [Variovorax sp. NFACC28]|nr:Very-short-patch-repair endonuclease [Variovorax sp. NFACC28]SEF65658.1 Very-short-patch-repair endonuclease [Variovorax sp. NFACC29]SFB74455.1 Very-short-patch-repair endonuclease [Variovorax sp. NFACC26]SFG54932.1 Very-short-patch-repair endonuclease [Variovorax sp. NFACC27]